MPSAISESRLFQPGTTGWTAADLDDPEIENLWFAGRYEIVEGVLTTMPPAYFVGGNAAFNLMFAVKTHLKENGRPGRFATEVDIVVDEIRVARADAAFLLPADERRQAKAVRNDPVRDPQRTRILVPPTLIIESLSPGHELHDTRTKRKWYAEFGVPNYWLLDAFRRSLECLVLKKGKYVLDVDGTTDDRMQPSLFPGLSIRLGDVWTS